MTAFNLLTVNTLDVQHLLMYLYDIPHTRYTCINNHDIHTIGYYIYIYIFFLLYTYLSVCGCVFAELQTS